MINQDQGSSPATLLGIIKSKDVTAIKILEIKSAVEEMQSDSSQFTKYFIQHQNVVIDCFDIALRPGKYMKNTGHNLTLDMTYRCIEILSNQYEQFIDWAIEVTEVDPVTHQTKQTILDSMFRILWDPQPLQETPITYLAKILNPFLYQKTIEIMNYLNKDSQIMETLCSHFYSKSISDIFIRLLETEHQNEFFSSQKLGFLNTLQKQMFQQEYEHIIEPFLQNYVGLLKGMLQKLDDRYDKQKYANLMSEYLAHGSLMKQLIDNIGKRIHNDEIFLNGLYIMQTLLRFDSRTIINCSSSGDVIHLHLKQDLIDNAINFVCEISEIVSPQTSKKQLIQFYKLVKLIIMIRDNKTDTIINKPFLTIVFKLIRSNPRNNILHNTLRDLVSTYTMHSQQYLILLQPEVGLLPMVNQLTPNNASIQQYQPQIYQIVQAIIHRLQNQTDASSQSKAIIANLTEAIKLKKKFYQVKICEESLKMSIDWGKETQELNKKFSNSDLQNDEPGIINIYSPSVDQSKKLFADSHSFFGRAKNAKSSGNLSLDGEESWKNVEDEPSLEMEVQLNKVMDVQQNQRFQIQTHQDQQIPQQRTLQEILDIQTNQLLKKKALAKQNPQITLKQSQQSTSKLHTSQIGPNTYQLQDTPQETLSKSQNNKN